MLVAPVNTNQVMKNIIFLILDRSGSMKRIKNDIIGSFNAQLESIKENNAKYNMESLVCLVTFSDVVDEPIFWLVNANDVTPLTEELYIPGGSTALFDAVGNTIVKAQSLEAYKDENTSFMFVILSDGEENNSKLYSSEKISSLVSECEGTDKFTFQYIGANQNLAELSSHLNLHHGNMLSFSSTSEGMPLATMAINESYDTYYSSRSRGIKSMTNLHSTDGSIRNVEDNS